MKDRGEGWGWRRGDRRRGDEGEGRGVGMEEIGEGMMKEKGEERVMKERGEREERVEIEGWMRREGKE